MNKKEKIEFILNSLKYGNQYKLKNIDGSWSHKLFVSNLEKIIYDFEKLGINDKNLFLISNSKFCKYIYQKVDKDFAIKNTENIPYRIRIITGRIMQSYGLLDGCNAQRLNNTVRDYIKPRKKIKEIKKT
ncbi:MAG: hypothetical protein HY951_06980 [Bacteroidia bacterium]|nr:hypothetical protein [Bacteroidia bacterium]